MEGVGMRTWGVYLLILVLLLSVTDLGSAMRLCTRGTSPPPPLTPCVPLVECSVEAYIFHDLDPISLLGMSLHHLPPPSRVFKKEEEEKTWRRGRRKKGGGREGKGTSVGFQNHSVWSLTMIDRTKLC